MSVEEAIEAFKDEGWRLSYARKDYPGFIEAVSKLSDKEFIQDIHVPELLVFPSKTQFYNHPGYTSGSLILQDKVNAEFLFIFQQDSIPRSLFSLLRPAACPLIY